MIRLQDTVIPIRYEKKDIKSIEGLVSDIATTISEKLLKEIEHKPFKCNVVLTYQSAYDDTKSKSLGQHGKQGRNRSNGVQNPKRRNKGN